MAVIVLLAPRENARPAREEQAGLRSELSALARQPLLLLALAMFMLGLLWPLVTAFDPAWASNVKRAWWFRSVPVALIIASALLFTRAFRGRSPELAKTSEQGPMFGAVVSLLNRRHALVLIAFILIFKLADSSIGFMIKPFWVDSGFTNTQIGLVSVNLGLVLSIAGGLLGGWYTDRVGIFRALWVLGLWQALSNLGYVAAAFMIPAAPQGTDIAPLLQGVMYSASAIESFTGGLGTAAFLAFLMAIVDKSRATTEYAILSSIFAFSRSIAGWAGGIGAHEMGYANYFLLTFVLAFPAYLMLPWIKRVLASHDEEKPAAQP